MTVEIDQSGKFEQLNTHTVIACANGKSNAIWISAATKRNLMQQLRKSLIPRKDLVPIIFAVLVFLLLDRLETIPNTVIIDEEYTGKDKIIEEALRKLFVNKLRADWQGHIRFKQVGKLSPAHALAWKTHRAKKRPISVKKILEEEVLRFLRE